jgi:O-antigen ligase
MSSQEVVSQSTREQESDVQDAQREEGVSEVGRPPRKGLPVAWKPSPFWDNRLVEAGMILALAGYYVVGNYNLGAGLLFHINPLYSLPFLVIFALLGWYRLPFAVALLPLALPYYYLPKPVYSHYSYELAEIVLAVCVFIAVVQLLLRPQNWPYRLSLRELRARVGPFMIPILVFILAAAISVFIAYARQDALRAFRQEIFDPIVYLLLALYCLRSRADVARLLLALFGSAAIVALEGLAQYLFFKNQLALDTDGARRITAVFGSANNIGLYFDYTLPVGVALLLFSRRSDFGPVRTGLVKALVILALLPIVGTLYMSQSRGAWIAIGVAVVALAVLALPARKMMLWASGALVVVGGAVFYFKRHTILNYFIQGHESITGISTVTKRLYLWLSALRMIHDRPWFGFGLDNWLCYYSYNNVCNIPALKNHHYWILTIPGTKLPTGLADEPTLSHPHNIFLHVWVSMGIFGLLAFLALIVLFFWLVARQLKQLHVSRDKPSSSLRWMVMGVGAAMLAGLGQGLGDSSFLEQDMAFCFWILVAALLLLRVHSQTPWRGRMTVENNSL